MKSIKFLILALLCAVAQGAWAQSPTTVSTNDELRTAIQTNGANITVTADIDLSNSTLSIPKNSTVTINLNGHTLDRGLTQRGEGGGQVITVRSGATLYLSNGTLKGGWGGAGGALVNEGGTVTLTNVTCSNNVADDRGGGICNREGGTLTMTGGVITNNHSNDQSGAKGGGGFFNEESATATLTGVTITGNTAEEKGGGGICNFGALTLDGCSITGNTAGTYGGGIWQEGTLNMQGAVTITGNTISGGSANNVYLKAGAIINVTGSLAGSSIGVQMENNTGTFTSGFGTYNSGVDPSTLFLSDLPMTVYVTSTSTSTGTEAQMAYGTEVSYIKCSWDEDNKQLLSDTIMLHAGNYTVLTSGGDISLASGYYVVRGTVSRSTIDLTGGHTVHLILCDGAKLTANYIHLANDEYHTGTGDRDSLYIYSQSYGGKMGKLRVDNSGTITDAGIGTGYAGSKTSPSMGALIVHGGDIYSKGGTNAAGIGGGHGGRGGRVYVYGGRVEAHGGDGAGTNSGAGAGIGSGYFAPAGAVWVYGGEVYAYGGQDAAGIGSGDVGNVMQHDFDDWIHAGWFTMYGGYVEAHGGGNGAGIGGGEYSPGPKDVSIYGGTVKAYGGEDAAGIGGGYYTMDYGISTGFVNIYGGEVYAEGKDQGAGIGGGENGDGATVTITGGIVIAKAGYSDGDKQAAAIGAGRDSDDHGSLTLADSLGVFITTNLYRSVKQNRVSDCRNNQYVQINKCAHGGAICTDNGSSVDVGCLYCYTSTMPYTFNANGNWNDTTKWFSGFMPHEGKNVAVKADATIPADYCANVGNIALQDDGSITIADGGQLIHSNAGVIATMQKAITGHGGDNNGGWNFIASPMVTNMTPSATNGFLTEDYDLYYYDEPAHYWRNFKPDGLYHGFDIEPQKGYLYASQANTTLGMTGTLQPSNDPVTISGLSHEASVLNGFNLVGNPFACNATIDRPFYVIEGKHVVAYEGNDPIAPGTGVMVQADVDHESVTFTKVTPEAQVSQPNNGSLQIALIQANTRSNAKIDNAIVSFNKGVQLEKFHFGNDAKLYIPQGGKDYAIAFSDRAGEIPLNFKATENGTYTLSFTTNVISSEAKKSPLSELFSYLHLIDNMTGADIDLLAHAVPELVEGQAWDGASTLRQAQDSATSYTFTARTTDYASRFKLVFASKNEDGASTGSATFAYYNGSEWVIDGPSTGSGTCILQVIDVMGRILSSETISGSVNKAIDAAPGVYILKLNDKVQKIVIK